MRQVFIAVTKFQQKKFSILILNDYINQHLHRYAIIKNPKNPRQGVNLAEYFIQRKLEYKEKLLRNTEEKVNQYFDMLRGGRLINLLKENRDDLVVGIQNYLFVPQREFIISPDSHIIDIFNSDEIGHKLLITGELGSRKTITLIELA